MRVQLCARCSAIYRLTCASTTCRPRRRSRRRRPSRVRCPAWRCSRWWMSDAVWAPSRPLGERRRCAVCLDIRFGSVRFLYLSFTKLILKLLKLGTNCNRADAVHLHVWYDRPAEGRHHQPQQVRTSGQSLTQVMYFTGATATVTATTTSTFELHVSSAVRLRLHLQRMQCRGALYESCTVL